ncbi:glycosyltransferase [Acidithrix sp. C25]|uniref:glycosyltransferase family 2 protein n=1 Tax=Acidithrix sp. C25 TaxID=1671482 RepID=UPI00191BC3D9|nr:glycosyltransferase [Acidithrix sp. C25]CAG4933051.1 unnamed protein product [Acidithrix sp. C25]
MPYGERAELSVDAIAKFREYPFPIFSLADPNQKSQWPQESTEFHPMAKTIALNLSKFGIIDQLTRFLDANAKTEQSNISSADQSIEIAIEFEGIEVIETQLIIEELSQINHFGLNEISELKTFTKRAANYPIDLNETAKKTKMGTRHANPTKAKIPANPGPGIKPILTIIVPTLDVTSARFLRLVKSIYQTTEVPFQTVIVDNGGAPQGYTTPVNTGVRSAQTEYIAIVNDDVQLLPGWWDPLQESLDSGELVVFPYTLEMTRYDFSAWCFVFKASSIELLSAGKDEFFDESFTIWFQDTDLYVRMREFGRSPTCVHESKISHGLSETVGTKDPIIASWIRKIVKKDQEHFVQKWGEGKLLELGFVNPFEEPVVHS